MPNKMQVMVLGCNGQLGHELIRQLGEEAVPKPKEVLDITNLKAVKELIPHVRPTVVVNCAGISSPTSCERNKTLAYRINTEAVDNLVKVCALTGIPYMHISCDQVFGIDPYRRKPYTETDPTGPINTYGTTKLAAENAVLRLGQCISPDFWKADFKCWIVRTSMLYERPWRATSKNWVYQMVKFGENRKDAHMSLPNDVFRSPTYAPHLAKSLIWMLRHYREILSGVFHIASSGAPSIYEIGSILSAASKSGINLSLTDRESYAKAHGRDPDSMPQYTALDSSKFADISPLPIPTWQSGLEEFAANWED